MDSSIKRPTSPRHGGASRAKKEQIVAKIKDKLDRAKGLVFTNYQGLTHKQLEDLKRKVKATNAELVVTKNSLLKRSLETSNFNPRFNRGQISNFKLPTATLFIYSSDPIEPLKQIARSIAVKFGILDGQSLTGEQVLKLGTLPSREVLLMQLLYQMQAPIYGLHRALSWNLQKFVMTLKAIEAKKGVILWQNLPKTN